MLARCLNESTQTWHAVVVTNDLTVMLNREIAAMNVEICGTKQQVCGPLASTEWRMALKGIGPHPVNLANDLRKQITAAVAASEQACKQLEQTVIQLG